MSRIPPRKRPSRNEILEIRGRPNILFVTVCAVERGNFYANRRVYEALRDAWREATHWQVGSYTIMPDHIHLFCAPGQLPPSGLRPWLKYWKRLVSQAGCLDDAHEWLRDGWDTQMRDAEHYREKWHYARNNPVRAGLVSTAEAWPYSGEIFPVTWT